MMMKFTTANGCMFAWAPPPPVELIVRAPGVVHRFNSPKLVSTESAVLVPSAMDRP